MEIQIDHNPLIHTLTHLRGSQKEALSPTNPKKKQHETKLQGEKSEIETENRKQKNSQQKHGSYKQLHVYHHVQPVLAIKPEDLVDPYQYLMDIYKMKEKVDSYFMKNTKEYIDYWKREDGITFTLDGWQLINYEIVINMEEFLKQDWRNVEFIGFSGCKIDDIKWRMFVDHAELFPNLKWLSLRNLLSESEIKHTINVNQEWTHPLSIPSKNYLKAFAKSHPHIQVTFG